MMLDLSDRWILVTVATGYCLPSVLAFEPSVILDRWFRWTFGSTRRLVFVQLLVVVDGWFSR